MMPVDNLINAAAGAGMFNQMPPFELPASTPLFAMEGEALLSELIETAIGQGRTLATPLNMAMFAQAIANGGIMHEPHIVSHITAANGNIIRNFRPQVIGRAMDASHGEILAQSMVDAVNFGTATLAGLPNVQTAGKTGTAQNETGIDHSWFIGFAPAENPQIALAIIIENTGGGTRATQLARRIFELAID